MTTEPTWRKASFSTNQGNCVELAALGNSAVGIRDSKYPDAGHLTLAQPELHALINAAQRGDCDHLL